ncbi:MAG: electron transfer flavoprotein-ubiquinone oxidoreductase [Gammaproteobacteria bacterium]
MSVTMANESMNYDVVIVGAGPAGLSAAIRLKQLCQKHDKDFSICILEKGIEVGAHILSGAVIEPGALTELMPDWQQKNAPLQTQVQHDYFYYLSQRKAFRMPTPPQMKNKNNYIISLSKLCRWLAQQAQDIDIDIFPGFAATKALYNDKQAVAGIVTGEMGIDKAGKRTAQYQPGAEIFARQTLLAEGCRGSLTEQIIQQYHLRQHCLPQTYAIGIKELWQIKPTPNKTGTVIHTIGWPLDQKTYGGSFIYHLAENKIALGLVIGLDYQNPWLNPFTELQRFKTHPLVQPMLDQGQRIAYGARALNEGGYQSIPKLTFPGGAIIGDAAGFINVPKIKGIHNAIKSGILAADAVFETLQQTSQTEAFSYEKNLQQSAIIQELHRVRNIRPAFRWGLWPGLAYSAIDTYIFRGKTPWTFKHHIDHQCLKKAVQCKKTNDLKADGTLTFDKLSSVYLTNTYHEENQPPHLKLKDAQIAINVNLKQYASPEQFYCPAAVYEIVYDTDNQAKLQINAQNCIHCKVCDIKDPTQNIIWTPPEGGGGPQYQEM